MRVKKTYQTGDEQHMPKLKKITTNSTPAEKEKLVFDLIHWLDKRDLFMDVHIYANHKCWSSNYYDKTLKDNIDIDDETMFIKWLDDYIPDEND